MFSFSFYTVVSHQLDSQSTSYSGSFLPVLNCFVFRSSFTTKLSTFITFWCCSLVWRWKIAVHSEMPTPRGVVELWSALRAYIDLTCAWKSPRTNHTQPRFQLLADGCGRPRGALSSSSLHSLFPRLRTFLSYFLQGWVRALSWRHFTPSPLHLPRLFSLPALLELFFF